MVGGISRIEKSTFLVVAYCHDVFTQYFFLRLEWRQQHSERDSEPFVGDAKEVELEREPRLRVDGRELDQGGQWRVAGVGAHLDNQH